MAPDDGIGKDVFYDANRIALLTMEFYFPGTGTSGDPPPRPEGAAAWRAELLGHLPKIELSILTGQYAQEYHLPRKKKNRHRHC